MSRSLRHEESDVQSAAAPAEPKSRLMSELKALKASHVPPTPEEFKEIQAGQMNVSAELMEFWRQCTDDELATWFRDPAEWSYVVRAPDGSLVADGQGASREECEKWAIRHALEYFDENAMVFICDGKPPSAHGRDYELDYHWAWHLLGDWHFVLWPPARSRRVLRQCD